MGIYCQNTLENQSAQGEEKLCNQGHARQRKYSVKTLEKIAVATGAHSVVDFRK